MAPNFRKCAGQKGSLVWRVNNRRASLCLSVALGARRVWSNSYSSCWHFHGSHNRLSNVRGQVLCYGFGLPTFFYKFDVRIETDIHSLRSIHLTIPELLNIESNSKIGRLHLFRSTVCRDQGLTFSDAASYNLPHRGWTAFRWLPKVAKSEVVSEIRTIS